MAEITEKIDKLEQFMHDLDEKHQAFVLSSESAYHGFIHSHSTSEVPNHAAMQMQINVQIDDQEVIPSSCPPRTTPRGEHSGGGGSTRFRGQLARSMTLSLQSTDRHQSHNHHRSSKEMFQSLVLRQIEEFQDPWAHHQIEKIPAERVRSYHYSPATQTWNVEESVVKVQKEPFDSGAMRQVYRMKKISQVRLTNWCSIEWQNAPNLVAKCYKTQSNEWNPQDRLRCFADVKLQLEAAELARLFNNHKPSPPKKVEIIACHVMECYGRPGCPVFGCERFIDGHDEHGNTFVKHNSNKGFVDSDENRQTPQAFSCFSFYASAGDRMVVDVQGVNDLYTDPQIHTIDRRFGNADLGCKGMAYFFANFKRNALCDYLQIPVFELSRRDKLRLSRSSETGRDLTKHDNSTTVEATQELQSPISQPGKWRLNGIMSPVVGQSHIVEAQVKCIVVEPEDLEEITKMLDLAATAARTELAGGAVESPNVDEVIDPTDLSAQSATGGSNFEFDSQTRLKLQDNLGHVHFELALLHIQGEFTTELGEDGDPLPDVPSCIFHLCKACMFGNISATQALGRIKQGPLDEVTILTLYLQEYMKIDVESTKLFSSLAEHRLGNRPDFRTSQSLDELENETLSGRSQLYEEQEIVEANFMGGGGWFVATVVKVEDPDDTTEQQGISSGYPSRLPQKITVRYEEGTEEIIVRPDNIKKRS